MMPIEKLTEYPHIGLDTLGRPAIVGKRFRVSMIVNAWKAPERGSIPEILEDYPVLTPGEIFSALAYYHDHQTELDLEIARERAEYEEALKVQNTSESHQKLMKRVNAYRAQQTLTAEAS